MSRLLRFCLDNVLIVGLVLLFAIGAGLLVAPFDWDLGGLPRDPVPVDAIPDLGENQQIVFTEWPGRSPRDVEDQVTYPLTVALLGLPDVKTVRSQSFFGFSSIYVIFEERADFYDSRTRILEKLASLPADALPDDAHPTLGPDATALGQVFWYTLEGRDAEGRPAGGWDPDELRDVQDWTVRYALLAADGVAEVAGVGGFVREWQVDVDPDALAAHGVTLAQVFDAVRAANADVGARTLEINGAEYLIRGLGFLKDPSDLEAGVVALRGGVPLTVGDVATVGFGPAPRRGALDKGGAEAVGGVVVVRYGANPLAAIDAVKAKIAEIAPGLPERTLADGRTSKVTVVPFYDRSGLIHETLDTLNHALALEILVTILVVIVLIMNLRSSLLIAGLLPLSVLISFIGMKLFAVDANIVALSGIAIAVGTMVDMGVVLCENIVTRLEEAAPDADRRDVIHAAAVEVGGAVLTAVATTLVGFLPVFTLVAAEGKLFRPLAYTKTFALLAAVMVALAVIPPFARLLFGRAPRRAVVSEPLRRRLSFGVNALAALAVGLLLTVRWRPLGPGEPLPLNLLFVALLLGGLLWAVRGFVQVYPRLLGWCLDHKALFLSLPLLLLLTGLTAWRGFETTFPFLPGVHDEGTALAKFWSGPKHAFPGLGQEFMPPLDEGSFLYMPTTMPHASIGEAMDVLQKLDAALGSVPEVESVVGKLGRVDSALDPAPVSMIETVVNYKPEWGVDADGERVRNWRPEIRDADAIWDQLVRAARLPGTTSAPKLQPIGARLVMLQSGMRAPMGVKVRGPDLETVERVGLEIERILKQVPSVKSEAVIADRVVGKPYLELDIDREAIARHGLTIRDVQAVIETGIGGRTATFTVEGRARRPVRVRYARERRDDLDDLVRLPVDAPSGARIPLGELATLRYVRGPQAIRSEDTFLTGYVLFDKRDGHAEVDVVEAARERLEQARDSGALQVPAGVSWTFAGSYENQVRSEKTLVVVLPAALLLIFLILYLQFRSTATTALVFSGIFIAWSGGFLLLWLYGQDWFLNVSFFGTELRSLFQMGTLNLSVAVWVGFVALFGIASDDGVVMATLLDQTFRDRRPADVGAIRRTVVEGASRRIRPAMTTTATTILALLPVLTSTGRGADVMVPMAIPSFGGMVVEVLTVLTVPVLYCWIRELRARR